MPLISTFTGASARAYGFNASLGAGVFPANTIMLWSTLDSTSVPSGWSRYSDIDDRFIVASFTAGEIGSQVAANSSASATISVSTTSAGAHTLTPAAYTGTGSTTTAPTAPTYSLRYNEPTGAHTHSSITINVSPAVPDSLSLPGIITTTTKNTIPANTVVFRKTVPSSGNFTSFTPPVPTGRGQCFYKGGPARAYANSSGDAIGTLNSTGAHDHLNTVTRYQPVGPGIGGSTVYDTYAPAGAHSHTASVPIHAIPKSIHLNAWTSTFEEPVEYGMIVMYKGDLLNLPAGWRKCDGTLGTPNLTGFVLGYSTTGTHGTAISNDAYVRYDPNPARISGSTTTSSAIHTHVPPGTLGQPRSPVYAAPRLHASADNAHNHITTVTGINSPSPGYEPPNVRLAFIQYKGI